VDSDGEKGLIFWIGCGVGIVVSVAVWFAWNFVRIEF
jgi:hypothetical protein